MSIRCPIIIDSPNLSVAWGRAFLAVFDSTKSANAPFVVSISGFKSQLPPELEDLRNSVDSTLKELTKFPSRVSALTIFPYAMWVRRKRPGCDAFCSFCIDKLLPRMKKLDTRNRLGTYFERMMRFAGTKSGNVTTVNQLLFVTDLLKNSEKWPRESALQLSCFDPAKDHTGQPVRGFPCLQQVGISHDGDGQIALNAFYPTQHVFDRGYGNYLGLCQLGDFIAHVTKLKFARLNCFVGSPQLGNVSKSKVSNLAATVRKALKAYDEDNTDD